MKRHQQRPVSASTEAAYERLSAYGFARRYAQGKTVADLSHKEETGYGSRLLAQSVESLTALADLPKLALPDGSFEVVVAFGVIEELEHPEELVREAKRVLKEGGVLLVSAADKLSALAEGRGGTDGRRGGMYVPEFRRLLERYFGHVRLYRQGAVAGGFVFPVSGESTGAVPLESVRLSAGGPRLGAGPPTTRSVIAVCTEAAEVLGGEEERAHLLLDRDGRVFDECEERAEDVELVLGEIRRMQETEVQAYLKTMSAQNLPLGALLRLIPQILLYYLYFGWADVERASGHRGMVLARARHRWNTTLVETRHRRDVVLAKARHRLDTSLEQKRYSQAATLEAARKRRDLAVEEAHRRRDMALEGVRHRQNLIIAEILHRQNVTLEYIIHRRNIIRGNVHALRQKDARGLARGVLRRSSALYRWLRGQRR
jgi:SAM-dependent methyltransferase